MPWLETKNYLVSLLRKTASSIKIGKDYTEAENTAFKIL